MRDLSGALRSPPAYQFHEALKHIEERPSDPLGLLPVAHRAVTWDLTILSRKNRFKSEATFSAANLRQHDKVEKALSHFEDTVLKTKNIVFRLNEDSHGRGKTQVAKCPARALAESYRNVLTALAHLQVEIRTFVTPDRTPSNSPCLKVFYRPDQAPNDPLLDEFLVAYERTFGSKLRAGYYRRTSKGVDVEIDAEGPHFIMEAKSGRAHGVLAQAEERFDPAVNPNGKVVIALVPSSFGLYRAAALCQKGVLVATSVPQALTMIRDLEADPKMRARLAVPGGPRRPQDVAWLTSFGMTVGAPADSFERSKRGSQSQPRHIQ